MKSAAFDCRQVGRSIGEAGASVNWIQAPTGGGARYGAFWHTGQKNVERPDCTMRWIVPVQSGVGQGSPSRS
jgi:hypothetical protein